MTYEVELLLAIMQTLKAHGELLVMIINQLAKHSPDEEVLKLIGQLRESHDKLAEAMINAPK